jgi:hypothetical protein
VVRGGLRWAFDAVRPDLTERGYGGPVGPSWHRSQSLGRRRIWVIVGSDWEEGERQRQRQRQRQRHPHMPEWFYPRRSRYNSHGPTALPLPSARLVACLLGEASGESVGVAPHTFAGPFAPHRPRWCAVPSMSNSSVRACRLCPGRVRVTGNADIAPTCQRSNTLLR